jgi:hypothetical protein
MIQEAVKGLRVCARQCLKNTYNLGDLLAFYIFREFDYRSATDSQWNFLTTLSLGFFFAAVII